jgi:hypothetical protein
MATAVAAVAYSALATVFLGRSLGVVASEWILRALKAMPATRRLASSRTQNA